MWINCHLHFMWSAAFAVGWRRKGAGAVLGVIVRENQHHPVAGGKWEHHLTVARARHFGNVSYRVMHDRTVHSPCFPGREADGGDFSLFPLQFPFIFQSFPTCSVITEYCDTTHRNPMGTKSKLMSLVP